MHLYNACDAAVQNAIINMDAIFFQKNEDVLLELLQKIATKRSNPSVHRLVLFSNIAQSDNEPVKDYMVRLKSAAKDCKFECSNCNFDLQPLNVRDQFICGLHNSYTVPYKLTFSPK